MERDRYQNADVLNAKIASLARRNNSWDKGCAFVKFLNSHNQNSFFNDRQTDKKKRYAYTPLEIQLTSNLFNICNYHCKRNNVEDAIDIFCILGYTYYREKKLRFRQRMENEQKKNRKQHNKRSIGTKKRQNGRRMRSREKTDDDWEVSEMDGEYSSKRATSSRKRSGEKCKTKDKDKDRKKFLNEVGYDDSIRENEQDAVLIPHGNGNYSLANENEILAPLGFPSSNLLFENEHFSRQVSNTNQSFSETINYALEPAGSETDFGYLFDSSVEVNVHDSNQELASLVSPVNEDFQYTSNIYSPNNEVTGIQNRGVEQFQDHIDYFQNGDNVEEQDYEIRLFQDNYSMQQFHYSDPLLQYDIDNMI